MKTFVEKLLFIIREKQRYLLLMLPFFLILFAIVAYLAVFHEPSPQQKPPSAVPTAFPTETEPTEFLKPEPTFDPETEAVLQELNKGEVQHAEEQAAIRNKYPWIEKLPIDENHYFAYFDSDTASFVGKLYPQSSSTTSIEVQVEQMKKEITEKLDDMNIPWKSYPFNWQVFPE